MIRAILLCALLTIQADAQQPSQFWAKGMKPGDYSVGYRTLDLGRALPPAGPNSPSLPRKFVANVFYPAVSLSSASLTLSDVVDRSCQPVEDNDAHRERCLHDLFPDDLQAKPGDKQRILDTKLAAGFELPAAKGKFPVVILDGGLTSEALTYLPLQEFLASHGYITIALPSSPDGRSKPAFDESGIETKARNVEAALRTLPSVPNADLQRVALAAWSVGGLSTALVQMGHPDIRALISLDGGMGYDYGLPLAKESTRFSLRSCNASVLHLTGKKPNRFPVAKDFSFFSELPCKQKFLAQVEGLNHGEFTFQGGEVSNLIVPTGDTKKFWRGRTDACGVVLAFLESFLKRESNSASNWKQAVIRGWLEGATLTREFRVPHP